MKLEEVYVRIIIRHLFEAPSWIDLYDIHTRFLLSPAQIAEAISDLKSERMIEQDGTHVRMTDDAKKWVVARRRDIFFGQDRSWADAPPEVRMQPLENNTPYLPKLSQIEKGFFIKN